MDRLSFLCLCALVCRDWVPPSRALLHLEGVRSFPDAFFPLIANPHSTLSRSIRSINLVHGDHRMLTATSTLSSITSLSIFMCDLKESVLAPLCMENVRILEIEDVSLDFDKDYHTFLGHFPRLDSLTIGGIHFSHRSYLSDEMSPLPLSEITTLRSDDDNTLQLLEILIATSPAISRLKLFVRSRESTGFLARWSESNTSTTSERELTIITSPYLDQYEQGPFLT